MVNKHGFCRRSLNKTYCFALRETSGDFRFVSRPLIGPNLFGKGKWEDINSIRLSIYYESGKKLVKSDIIKGKQLSVFENEEMKELNQEKCRNLV